MESSSHESGQPTPGQEQQGTKPRKWRRIWRRLLALALVALLAFITYEYLGLPGADSLQGKNPETTALIEQRAAEAREAGRKPRRRQYWVALPNMPKHVIDAVLLSEDTNFYFHEGVDTAELEKALQQAWKQRKLGRGASTITQQLAKNLWLSTDRSLLRKAKELVLARRLEKSLSKGRILMLYLNVAEWGDGVYGAEAAAREHFGVSLASLSVAQSAILASMLPAPRKRSPKSGSKALKQQAHRLIERMEAAKRIPPEQVPTVQAEIDRILGGGKADAEDSGDEDDY